MALPRRRRSSTLILAAAVSVLVLALDVRLFWPYVGAAATALRHPLIGWLAVAVVAELLSMAAAGHLSRRMLQAGGTRVPARTMVGLAYAANAVSMSLPAGGALSTGYTFRRLRQLGASAPTAGFTLVSTGVLSTFAYGIVVVLAIVLSGGAAGGPLSVVAAVLAVAAVVAASRTLPRHLDRLDRVVAGAVRLMNRALRRPRDSGIGAAVGSIQTLRAINPRGRDWAAGLGLALLNWIGDVVCLLAACRAVGASDLTLGLVLFAYVGAMSVSSVSLVPGGLGVVEAALIVVLTHGGVGAAAAASGVVLFRLVSFAFVVLAGWVAWFGHWAALRRLGEHSPQPRSSKE